MSVVRSYPLIAFFVNGQAALLGLGRASWFRRTLGLRDVLFFLLLLAAQIKGFG